VQLKFSLFLRISENRIENKSTGFFSPKELTGRQLMLLLPISADLGVRVF
jgi:hypothetical protein